MADKKSKKKPVKMALNDFLMNTTTSTSSWADEVLELPTAPAAAFADSGHHDDFRHRSSSPGGFNDRFASRSERPGGFSRERRAPAPLPDQPPFTAYVGNLPYELFDNDVEEFFSGLQISNIRIIRDMSDRPKGFGYVEFANRDALASAVELDGQPLKGRNVRVNVAEPPKDRQGSHEDRSNVDTWRRSVTEDSPRRSTFGEREQTRSFARSGGDGGFHSRRDDERSQSGEPSRSETASTWRRQEPVERAPLPSPGMGPERRRGWGFNRAGGEGGSYEERPYGGRPRGDDREGLRSPFSHSRRTSIESRGSDVPSAGPMQRKKLDLKPRTLPVSQEAPAPSPSTAPSSARSVRSNPFGAAKPRDENEMQRRVEQRKQERAATIVAEKPSDIAEAGAEETVAAPAEEKTDEQQPQSEKAE